MFWIFFILSLLFPSQVLAASPFCGNTTDIDTALGCVPVEIGPFVVWLSNWIFGVAGGVAFLMMVYGFFLMATSSGDPKAVQGAKETVTSAITGLLVSIFGVFILRLVTLNILQLPGL